LSIADASKLTWKLEWSQELNIPGIQNSYLLLKRLCLESKAFKEIVQSGKKSGGEQ